jgi:hypothetical protein
MWDYGVQNKILSRCPYLLDVNPYVCGTRLYNEKIKGPLYVHIPKKINIDNNLYFPQCINL